MNTISKKKILGISGSTRNQSLNTHILRYIQKSFADTVDVEIYEGVYLLPYFNPDIDTPDFVPDSVKIFREKIESSDVVVVCTPEYVFSLPGALKNAIEWTVSTTVFSKKPVAFIVAAASGEKAMESLHTIFGTIEANISREFSLLINGAKGKFDSSGTPKEPLVIQEIEKMVNQLISATEK